MKPFFFQFLKAIIFYFLKNPKHTPTSGNMVVQMLLENPLTITKFSKTYLLMHYLLSLIEWTGNPQGTTLSSPPHPSKGTANLNQLCKRNLKTWVALEANTDINSAIGRQCLSRAAHEMPPLIGILKGSLLIGWKRNPSSSKEMLPREQLQEEK